MRILLTNDDGYESGGLRALFSAASDFGQVTVVAPDRGYSMCSHAITTNRPISVETRDDPLLGEYYVCAGTPADCVRIALHHLPIGPFDWVFSGINRGANAGVDVYYSGTVAAAREAAFMGTKAVALSQLIRPNWTDNWQDSGNHARHVLEQFLHKSLFSDYPMLTNINLPHVTDGAQLQGIKTCTLTAEPLPISFTTDQVSDRVQEVRYAGKYFERPAPASTDFHDLCAHWITVTPLQLDLTAGS